MLVAAKRSCFAFHAFQEVRIIQRLPAVHGWVLKAQAVTRNSLLMRGTLSAWGERRVTNEHQLAGASRSSHPLFTAHQRVLFLVVLFL